MAAQMMRFIQPLLEVCNDKAELDKTFGLGVVFWNLALSEDDQREEMLARITSALSSEQQALEFRALASDMVRRHRAMFPAMHR